VELALHSNQAVPYRQKVDRCIDREVQQLVPSLGNSHQTTFNDPSIGDSDISSRTQIPLHELLLPTFVLLLQSLSRLYKSMLSVASNYFCRLPLPTAPSKPIAHGHFPIVP
jgi:hypothetical protein